LYEPLKSDSLDKGLSPEHPTVASLLKANGYETALIGKWHLGWKPEFGPNRHGYDEFFGILSGAADYFTHYSSDSNGLDLWENLAPVEQHRVPDGLTLAAGRAVRHSQANQTVLSQSSLHCTSRTVGRS